MKPSKDYFGPSAKCCRTRDVEAEHLNCWPPERDYRFRYFRKRGEDTCELQVSYQGGEWQDVPLVEEGEGGRCRV